jgi:hypothetical protein
MHSTAPDIVPATALLQDDVPSKNMVAHLERKSSPAVFDESFVDRIHPDFLPDRNDSRDNGIL